MHDRCALLLIGITVKGEQLVPLFNPCRSLPDRRARDVDREVIPRIGPRRRPLKADRRRLQPDFDRTVGTPLHRQTQRPTPESRLASDIAGCERELVNPHLALDYPNEKATAKRAARIAISRSLGRSGIPRWPR